MTSAFPFANDRFQEKCMSGMAAPRRSTDRVADVRLPAEWIADEIGADLVVIGRRGLNRVKRILLGSTSEQVAGNASWVLIVQPAPAAR